MSISARLKEFNKDTSPSRHQAKTLGKKGKEFLRSLKESGAIAEFRGRTFLSPSGLSISDPGSFYDFCRRWVLPLEKKMAEERGIFLNFFLMDNLMLTGDILHHASICECPVFFSANTFFSPIFGGGEVGLHDNMAGMHFHSRELPSEYICIFADLIRSTLLNQFAITYPPSAMRVSSLGQASKFFWDNSYFSARSRGADSVLDSRIYDSLLHEIGHRIIGGKPGRTEEEGELFAYAFSLSGAMAPHIGLATILNMYAEGDGSGVHFKAARSFFEMFNPYLIGERNRQVPYLNAILEYPSVTAEGICEAASRVLVDLCGTFSIDLEKVRADVIDAAKTVVFGV